MSLLSSLFFMSLVAASDAVDEITSFCAGVNGTQLPFTRGCLYLGATVQENNPSMAQCEALVAGLPTTTRYEPWLWL